MNIRQREASCAMNIQRESCDQLCNLISPSKQIDLIRSHAKKSFEKCSFLTSEFINPLDRLECLLCNAEGKF